MTTIRRRSCFDCGQPVTDGDYSTCLRCETACWCGDPRCHGCEPAEDTTDRSDSSGAWHPNDDGPGWRLDAVQAGSRDHW